MSILNNPVVDLKPVPIFVYYLDSGLGIMGVTGNPNGAISANAGSFAIDPTGIWYRCSGGTTWIVASVAGSPVGVLFRNITNTGNVAPGSSNLHQFTVAANTLANDGDCIRFTTMFTTAANTNSKQIQLNIGGTIVFDTGLLATPILNNHAIHMDVMLYRFNSTQIKVRAACEVEATGGVSPFVNYIATLAGVSNLNNNSFQVTWVCPTSTANNDVVQSATVGEKL